MYARSTALRGSPNAIEQGLTYVRDEVRPLLQHMDGYVGLSMLADRGTGRSIVTTAWETEAAMRASDAAVRDTRTEAGGIFDAQPEVDEWEIALLHRVRETPEGAAALLFWTRGDPAGMPAVLDEFRATLTPQLEDLPGFCSVSVLVDRPSGRSAVTVTYESRTALNRASSAATDLRQEFIRATNLTTEDLAECDLLLAHLRVPETI